MTINKWIEENVEEIQTVVIYNKNNNIEYLGKAGFTPISYDWVEFERAETVGNEIHINERRIENTKIEEEIIMTGTFTLNGKTYERKENGYCFVTENGKKTRTSSANFNAAYDEYITEQTELLKAEKQIEEARETLEVEIEEAPKAEKPKKRARKNKNVTNFPLPSGEIISLTDKQLCFIERMPEDDFYENGIDSALWVDCYCDTLEGEFNAMQAGAMISTLREKGILSVAKDKRNGKKAVSFQFTELGKELARVLGMN